MGLHSLSGHGKLTTPAAAIAGIVFAVLMGIAYVLGGRRSRLMPPSGSGSLNAPSSSSSRWDSCRSPGSRSCGFLSFSMEIELEGEVPWRRKRLPTVG